MSESLDAILRGDYHVHSSFSDDAVSTIAQNLDAAGRVGLTEIRLIDHVRKDTTWVPDFLAEVARESIASRRDFGELAIFTGVEAKILNARGEIDVPHDLIVGAGGVDAIVIADHQFPGLDGPWSPATTREKIDAGLSASDALDILVGATIAAMESVESGQLAHCFSILPKIGLSENDLTDDQLRAWASAAAQTGTLIEVNEKWGCPEPRSLRAALAAGARLVASTDSHIASDVGRYARVTELIGGVES
jgi:putative hydrolase